MNWFQQLCRNTGLMFHNIAHPEGKPADHPQKRTVNHTVEEKQVDDKTIIRRTTIEEIEIRRKEGD